MENYKKAWKQYAVFDGRSTRSEFWTFALVNLVISLVLGMLDNDGVNPLQLLFALATLVPSIAIGARRLHDIGKSGWWQLLFLIPVIGAIILIVFYLLDSMPVANQYGPTTKTASVVAEATTVEPQTPPTPPTPPTQA